MCPIGSNGASQAVLDARVPAGCLRDHGGDPIEALERYEAERRPATAAVVLANRQLGPEKLVAVVEERAPGGFDRLDDVVAPDELAKLSEEYRTLAGCAVDELNARVSLLARTW